MADRPIIFAASMVKALLDGRKTQTRRVLKPQPVPFKLYGTDTLCDVGLLHVQGEAVPRITLGRVVTEQEVRFAVGDRLWVREAWRTFASLDGTPPRDLYRPGERGAGVLFEADDGGLAITKAGEVTLGPREDRAAFGKLRTPIFMPRWASRLTLHVTEVRVERLRGIGEEDAGREGVRPAFSYPGWDSVSSVPRYRWGFHEAWEETHGPDAWSANPWVSVIGFRVERANVDQIVASSSFPPSQGRGAP